LHNVATLPCETLGSAKQAINDKLQDSVATYLRCGGVVSNHVKKGLSLGVQVKIFFEIDEYLAQLQARTCLSHSHALCTPGHGQHTAKRQRKCTIQLHVVPVYIVTAEGYVLKVAA